MWYQNDCALTLTPEETESDSINFNCVQSLRNIKDLVLSMKACCSGDLRVTQGLMALQCPIVTTLQGLHFQTAQLQGFIDSAEILQARIQNTIDMVRRSHVMPEKCMLTMIDWLHAQ